jgi:monofunctional biosynthetic peptidoglycan transglycosylase
MTGRLLSSLRAHVPRPRRAAIGLTRFVVTALAANLWLRWPDVRALATENPTTVAAIQRERGTPGAPPVEWAWVPLREISPHLMRAVLVAEDIDFFSHSGFSWAEIRSALTALSTGGPPRGASTITQQLAKTLWLWPGRSLLRKVLEAALTIDMERILSKRRILELYLDIVPFGPGVFGAEAAARRYFGKPALFLTERESAMLAAGLSRPSVWNPTTVSDAYAARVELILRRMASAEFLWRHLANL